MTKSGVPNASGEKYNGKWKELSVSVVESKHTVAMPLVILIPSVRNYQTEQS
jgi:hypothetical protein